MSSRYKCAKCGHIVTIEGTVSDIDECPKCSALPGLDDDMEWFPVDPPTFLRLENEIKGGIVCSDGSQFYVVARKSKDFFFPALIYGHFEESLF